MTTKIKIVGAGLAGCEAAWQCARRGHEVELYEMRPVKSTPAQPVALAESAPAVLSTPPVAIKMSIAKASPPPLTLALETN